MVQLQASAHLTTQPQFADLTGHWAANFIQGLADRGLVRGTGGGKFAPDALITRAQYAALLAAIFKLPVARSTRSFTDVPADFWGNPAIQQVCHSGLMTGFGDNTFRPNQPILRCHVLLPLVKALNLPGADIKILQRFEDAAVVPNYATDAIARATQAQLIVNYPRLRQFKPNWEASRAEVAACLYQALVYRKQLPAVRSPYLVDPNQPHQPEPHPPEAAITVVIDPGHGGPDPGAVGIGGLQEKQVILPIAQEIAKRLQQHSIQAILTRTDDRDLDLAPRVEIAQQAKADIFVSIHANSAGLDKPQVSGVETFHHAQSATSGQLAQSIHQQILQTMNVVDRGVKQANFFVLRHATMPAVLVEVGFVTGRDDAAKLADPAYRQQMASAIAQGVLAYVQTSVRTTVAR